MKYFIKLIFTVFLIESVRAQIVSTKYGPVQGAIRTTETGKGYFSFQGIPYAKPPVDKLRFRVRTSRFTCARVFKFMLQDPEPPIPWVFPLNCTVEGPIFWGVSEVTGEIEGSFDALHVNVFTNNLNPATPYPVMVW